MADISFKSAILFKYIIDKLIENEETIKGEYKNVQVFQEMIDMRDQSIKSSVVKGWFDCGRPEALLNDEFFIPKLSANSFIT